VTTCATFFASREPAALQAVDYFVATKGNGVPAAAIEGIDGIGETLQK